MERNAKCGAPSKVYSLMNVLNAIELDCLKVEYLQP